MTGQQIGENLELIWAKTERARGNIRLILSNWNWMQPSVAGSAAHPAVVTITITDRLELLQDLVTRLSIIVTPMGQVVTLINNRK